MCSCCVLRADPSNPRAEHHDIITHEHHHITHMNIITYHTWTSSYITYVCTVFWQLVRLNWRHTSPCTCHTAYHHLITHVLVLCSENWFIQTGAVHHHISHVIVLCSESWSVQTGAVHHHISHVFVLCSESWSVQTGAVHDRKRWQRAAPSPG